ncbi:GAF domain-containing sensor histidine kinase [Pedobacter endophyticus]|uniref:histidine kinase n=1 Tax=Pedobacter endophyticus TaxID=2789740 RepID=A0A7S9L026_9SPHI|nr:GAF domain-containing sensor histidine kinase [Pedobacter endophyticus]QPH40005.1 GAF domain-containing sensor histidine kinase [Pedobacter endophyticus]
MTHIHPTSAETRLRNGNAYEILSLNPDLAFDNICKLAAGIFEVDNACISFVGDEVFTISRLGDRILADEFLKGAVEVLETEEVFLANNNEVSAPTFCLSVPIKTLDDKLIGVISVYSDTEALVTDKKVNMLKSLSVIITDKLATRTAIRNTMRAQDDRLHVLIHDLKNPMTTISLQAELMSRMQNIDEKAATIAKKINVQSKTIVDQLNNILSSARRENGSFKPQKEKIDLSSILRSAMQSIEFDSVKKNKALQFDDNEELIIYGDKEKLSTVFYQLLQNANKFSQPNGVIEISHQKAENTITIAIKDSGVGLSAEDLDRLFVKFAPLSSKSTAKELSNGLGLTLAKMYVDVHKGKIWAESAGQNEGTTFFVELPIK